MEKLKDKMDQAQRLHDAGQLEAAAACCREALSQHGEHPDVLNLLGIIEYKRGAADTAVAALGRALRLNPGNPYFHGNLALIHAATGRLETAANSYRAALRLKPDMLAARHALARCLTHLGRQEEALTHYHALLQVQPENLDALIGCGDAHRLSERNAQAAELYRRALTIDPNAFEARSKLGLVLCALGQEAAGIEQQRQALADQPAYAEGWHNLGVSLMEEGRLEEARSAFQEAIRLNPNKAAPHCALAELSRYRPDDPAVAAMERLAAAPGLPEGEVMSLCFALGKVFDGCGEYGRAFAHFQHGNRLKRATFDYNIAAETRAFERLMKLFDREFFARRRRYGDAAATPLFILGMPRTGTTLIEQILSCHPLVFGAGEVNHLSQVLFADPKLSRERYPDGIEALSPEDSARMGREYLQKLRAHAGGRPYQTNKTPSNVVFIGVIKLLFPNARVIHCRRDPIDTCLSCYQQVFTGFYPYAYDLSELGRYYRIYDRLMAHWHVVLPGFVYDLQYEALVTDPERQIRGVLEYCGLPFEPACLEFHSRKRQVKTSSVTQVRRPLYRDAVQRWKSYEAHLGPLLDALADGAAQ